MAIVSVGSSFKILSIEYEWKRELKHTIDVDTRLSRSRYTKKIEGVVWMQRKDFAWQPTDITRLSVQKKPNCLLCCMFCCSPNVYCVMCVVCITFIIDVPPDTAQLRLFVFLNLFRIKIESHCSRSDHCCPTQPYRRNSLDNSLWMQLPNCLWLQNLSETLKALQHNIAIRCPQQKADGCRKHYLIRVRVSIVLKVLNAREL